MDDVVPWWADRDRAEAEFSKISAKDAETFVRVDDQLKKLARYLQPFFLEPPPEIDTRSMRWLDRPVSRRANVSRRFRATKISQLVSFLTGSLGEFLDRNYESETIKTMFLANNVYGKHGGPVSAGHGHRTALPSAERRRARTARLLRTRDGRHGRNHPGAGGGRPESSESKSELPRRWRRSTSRNGRARGVVLEDGTEIRARIVLSNADPEAHFPEDGSERPSCPTSFCMPFVASRWKAPAPK